MGTPHQGRSHPPRVDVSCQDAPRRGGAGWGEKRGFGGHCHRPPNGAVAPEWRRRANSIAMDWVPCRRYVGTADTLFATYIYVQSHMPNEAWIRL